MHKNALGRPEMQRGVDGFSLRGNLAWTVVGAVGVAAFQWLILATIAKLGGSFMVGTFAMAVAVTTPVFSFLNLHLRGLQSTDATKEFHFTEYFGLRLWTSLFGVLVVLGYAIGTDQTQAATWVLALMAIRRALDGLADVIYGYFQQVERIDLQYKSMLFNSLCACLFAAIALIATNSLPIAIAATLAASVVTFALTVIPQWRHLVGSSTRISELWSDSHGKWPHYTRLRLLWDTALPLGIVVFISALNTSLPRLLIHAKLGTEALGVYAGLTYITAAALTVIAAAGQSLGPRLSRLARDEEFYEFFRLLRWIVAAGFAAGIFGAIVTKGLGSFLLELLYTKEYSEYVDEFIWVNIAMSFAYGAAFLLTALTALRALHHQAWLYGFSLISGLVVTYIALPYLGLNGATLGLGVANVVQFIGGIVLLRIAVSSRNTPL